jgi:hypothetical protein
MRLASALTREGHATRYTLTPENTNLLQVVTGAKEWVFQLYSDHKIIISAPPNPFTPRDKILTATSVPIVSTASKWKILGSSRKISMENLSPMRHWYIKLPSIRFPASVETLQVPEPST